MRIRSRTLLAFVLLGAVLLSTSTACQKTAGEPVNSSPPPAVKDDPSAGGGPITITAVGDIMMGSTYPANNPLPPNDGADVFTETTPLLTGADLTFGNLEGPMLEGGSTAKCGPASKSCFAFRVPTRFGRHLKNAGFDVMNLANNHASDFGDAGRASSEHVLESLGIKHDGGSETDVAKLVIKGRRITIMGFATNAVSLNLNDIEKAQRAVAEQKRDADILMVSFHGGAEGEGAQHVHQGNEIFLGESRGDLREFTHAVIDAGADLVIGSGPHVVRAMELYKHHLIAYSLGNFCTYGFRLSGATALSIILDIQLNPDGTFAGGKIHPARQIGAGVPALDPNGTIINVVRSLTAADFPGSGVKVAADGTITAP
jgi:hypothetical protein